MTAELWTPGPWRVEQDTTQVWGNCNADDLSDRGMGYPITLCRITPSGSWTKRPDDDEGEANAHLIAAAPDLYEAQRISNEIVAEGAMVGFNPHEGDWAERLFAHQAVITAALRKARGEA